MNLLCNYYKVCSCRDSWTRGVIKAKAQNWSRRLAESAANKMTPTLFSKVFNIPTL